MPKKIEIFAKEQGFDSVKKIGTWRDHTVYSPYLFSINGITPPTGLPRLILVKDNKLRWVCGKEAFTILSEI